MSLPRRYEVDEARLRGRVAVLMGGDSAERAVSLAGGRAVYAALRVRLPDLLAVDAGEDVLEVLTRERIKHVFLMLHGRGGEDGRIQGALDTLGVSYTGSGVMSSALSMDKLRCKWLWRGLGIDTPLFAQLYAHCNYEELIKELGSELIVKPAREGSSIGMMRVGRADELSMAWKLARQYDSEVLVEKWIHGPEYTVAIVEDEVLPPIRLETERAFYDYEAKYHATTTRYHCPAELSTEDFYTLSSVAGRAYHSIGCEGWGRVDLMRDAQGRFLVLEVNTCPGMTDHSLVPMAAAAAGIDFQNLVVRIFNSSLAGGGDAGR